MKLSKTLLIPLLFLATSCVSIDSEAKGSIFDASGSVNVETPLTYYEEGKFGDEIPAIAEGATSYTLDFANNIDYSKTLLTTTEAVFEEFPKTKEVVKTFTLDNIYKGVYGLNINYQKGLTNNITFTLKDEIKIQYVSIKCSPSFYNKLIPSGENAGSYAFTCQDSALKLTKEDNTATNYVKLPAVKEKDEAKDLSKAKEYTVTFDLGKKSSIFSLSTALYSTVINSITLY